MQVKKQQLEPDIEKWTGSKLEKEYLKAVYRKLTNLITWTTALSNSMKLSHAVWGHSRRPGHGGEF